jgi:hypothetical protein
MLLFAGLCYEATGDLTRIAAVLFAGFKADEADAGY